MSFTKKSLRRKRSELQLEEIERHKQVTLVQNQIHLKINQTKKIKKNFICQHMKFPQTCQQFQPNTNYYQKFWKLFLLNQMTKCKIDELSQIVSTIQNNTFSVQELLEQRQNILSFADQKRKRIKSELVYKKKNIRCPFHQCYKQYISQTTLHLHMKLKHNTTGKAAQENYAESFWNWKQGNTKIYPGRMLLPPGYLQEYGMLTGRYPRQKYSILRDKHKWVEGVVDLRKVQKVLSKKNENKQQNLQNLSNSVSKDKELQNNQKKVQSQGQHEYESDEYLGQGRFQSFNQQQQKEVKIQEN